MFSNKNHDILNELVYQIDDVVYAFYTESNVLIASKKQQEVCLDFRERALNTINEMNVRSLELLSEVKDESVVEARAAHLLQQNQALVDRALDVIARAPGRFEFAENVQEMIQQAQHASKEAFERIRVSDGFESFMEKARDGFDKSKDAISQVFDKAHVKETTEQMARATKEAYEVSSHALHEGVEALSDWAKHLRDERADAPDEEGDRE